MPGEQLCIAFVNMFYTEWTDTVTGVVVWSGRTAAVDGDELYWIANRGVWFDGISMVATFAPASFMQHIDFTVLTWIRSDRAAALDEVLYSINKPNPVAPGDEDFFHVSLNASFLRLKFKLAGTTHESVSESAVVT
jgi:hypothetical protein